MNASSLCTIIGMLCLGVSWAQELGNWKAIGGDVKGGGFQYLGAMHLPAEDQANCHRPKITVQISTKGAKVPENLAVILFDDAQESFAQIGRSFTHTGYNSFCESTVEASKTLYKHKKETKKKAKTNTRGRPCGWKSKGNLELTCGLTKSCTKGFRVEKFHKKISTAKTATAKDAQSDTWHSQTIQVSQTQPRTWYFAIAQCGDAPMTDFKFRIDSKDALPIPEPSAPAEEEEDDGDVFWGGYAYGAIGGAVATLFVFLLFCACAYCVKCMCAYARKTKHSNNKKKKKKAVVPVDEGAVVAKVVSGQTVVVGHAVVM